MKWKAETIHVIGDKSIGKDIADRPVFPSDHLGLVASFTFGDNPQVRCTLTLLSDPNGTLYEKQEHKGEPPSEETKKTSKEENKEPKAHEKETENPNPQKVENKNETEEKQLLGNIKPQEGSAQKP